MSSDEKSRTALKQFTTTEANKFIEIWLHEKSKVLIFTWIEQYAVRSEDKLRIIIEILSNLSKKPKLLTSVTKKDLQILVVDCMQLMCSYLEKFNYKLLSDPGMKCVREFLSYGNFLLANHPTKENESKVFQALFFHPIRRLIQQLQKIFSSTTQLPLDPNFLFSFLGTINAQAPISPKLLIEIINLIGKNNAITFSDHKLPKEWLEQYIMTTPLGKDANNFFDALAYLLKTDIFDQPISSEVINKILNEIVENPTPHEPNGESLSNLEYLVNRSSKEQPRKLIAGITDLDMSVVNQFITAVQESKTTKKKTAADLSDEAYYATKICTTINNESAIPAPIELPCLEGFLECILTSKNQGDWPIQAANVLSSVGKMCQFGAPKGDQKQLLDQVARLVEKLNNKTIAKSLSLQSISQILDALTMLDHPLTHSTAELISQFKDKLENTGFSKKLVQIYAFKVSKYLYFSQQTNTKLASLKKTGLPSWLSPHAIKPAQIREGSLQHSILKKLREFQLNGFEFHEESHIGIWNGDILIRHQSRKYTGTTNSPY